MKQLLILLFTNLLVSAVFAGVGPQKIVYQGRLTDESGTKPLLGTVDLFVQVLSPDKSCLLFEELHRGVNLTRTQGVFAVQIGAQTSKAERTSRDPGLSFSRIFGNSSIVPVRAPASFECPSGYVPKENDPRVIRVAMHDGQVTKYLGPDQVVGTVPYAVSADSLQGHSPEDFIQVSGKLTQTSALHLVGGQDASSLHHHDSRYLKVERDPKVGALVADRVCRTNGSQVICDVDLSTRLPATLEGPPGPTGPAGPRGAPGVAGAPGPAGPMGPQGPKGDKGEAGSPGAPGSKGDAGARGGPGPAGPVGPQGPKGDAGARGALGPAGPVGAAGPKGDKGAQGPAGLQGPKGDTGPAGATGPQGPKGDIGPAGPQGPKGDIGATGTRGPQGPTGAKGPKGEMGPRGATGATGAPGPQGPKGEKGDNGERGPQGVAGPTGPKGAEGKGLSSLGQSCPTGQVLVGLNTNGTLRCASAFASCEAGTPRIMNGHFDFIMVDACGRVMDTCAAQFAEVKKTGSTWKLVCKNFGE